jgi:hypothetical protein
MFLTQKKDNSMNKKLLLSVAGAALCTLSAFGAGFALYEGSASGTALGGAVMGKAVDASALFYNPATISDFTNTVVTVGFVTEHPTADTAINGHHGRKMDPGAFMLPHTYVVVPIPRDFSFGLGFAPEYGLVRIRIAPRDDALAVVISNTGDPIPAEKLDRVFQKFYQADESHATEGNGIGLAIVKKVVELHQGTITAESSRDKTSFTVVLPQPKNQTAGKE